VRIADTNRQGSLWQMLAYRLFGPLAIIALWEGVVRIGVVKSVFLPAPSSVLGGWAGEWRYWGASTLVTVRDIAIAYLVGTTCGCTTGLLIGRYRKVDLSIGPVLLLLSPIPIVTFLPLFIIWFGLGLLPVLLCGVIAAFFPTLMNTASGVKNVDRRLIEVAQNFSAVESDVLRKVVLPASLPHIANGLRLSIQLTFLVTPVAEMIMGDIGLGGFIWRSADLFKSELVVLGQLTLGAMGLSLFRTFDALERRWLLPWTARADGT